MTLEQRVEALEKGLSDMKAQQKANEEFGELVRKLTEDAIKNANRPGGALYAAQKQAASEYNGRIRLGINNAEVCDQDGVTVLVLGRP